MARKAKKLRPLYKIRDFEKVITNMPTNRNDKIDSLKYCLMVLVIAGHVFSQPQFSASIGCTIVSKWIYMFHMPLFVFISGYFSRKKKDTKDFIQSCWKLIEPLIIFQVLMRGYLYFSKGTIALKDVFTPWWVLWYLLSLVYWRLMLQVIPDKILQNTKLIILMSSIICILSGFLPFNRFLSLQRTCSFLPFFFFGYCMRGKIIFIDSKYKPLCWLFLIATVFFPLYFSKYLGDLTRADPYINVYEMCRQVLVFVLSIPMSIAFMNICPNTPWLAKQGKLSMQYFIYHAIIVFFLMKVVNKFELPNSFIAAIFYTVLVTAGIGVLSYLPHFNKLTAPSSFFKR